MSRSEFLGNKKSDSSSPRIDWFSERYMEWFVGKDDAGPILSIDGWFNNLIGLIKATIKRIFRKRIGFEDVKVVIAKSHEIKDQYYQLRERLYRKKLGFKKYNGSENSYDRTGDIIIGLYKNEVIAGARLDFSNRHNDIMYNDNPELNGFTYKDLAKRLDPNFKEGEIFTEICAVAVYEKVKADFYEKFFSDILVHAKNMKASYVFGIAYPHLFDTYNNALQNLHLDLKIFDDLKFNIKGSYGKNKTGLEFFPLGTVLKGADF